MLAIFRWHCKYIWRPIDMDREQQMTNNSNLVGRFAPSPSGRMHLGNIYAALMSYASVKSRGGRWLLRIEDLDKSRCKREYAEQIIDDLRWLGLVPDLGASASTDDSAYYQSNRDEVYNEYFEQLRKHGLLYECFCRRNEINVASAPHASDGHVVYGGTCRILTEAQRNELRNERKPCWRIRMPDEVDEFTDGKYGLQRENLATDRGDFIVRRADGNFSYNLAVVVDDALMGVTEVVRGCDLLTVSHEQRYIYKNIGYKAPHYCHFPLLLSTNGSRLSKRDHSLALDVLRTHYSPEDVIGMIAWLVDLQPSNQRMTAQKFVQAFDWQKIPQNDIVVNIDV